MAATGTFAEGTAHAYDACKHGAPTTASVNTDFEMDRNAPNMAGVGVYPPPVI